MFLKDQYSSSKLNYVIFLLSVVLTIFLMGCVTDTRTQDLHAPISIQKIEDDPFTILWNQHSNSFEDGFIIYMGPESAGLTEIDRVGENVEEYAFSESYCEYINRYGSDGNFRGFWVKVSSYNNNDIYGIVKSFSESRVSLEDISNIILNDKNPCRISWEHSGVGFDNCRDDEEQGFRILLAVKNEAWDPSTSNIDTDTDWVEYATVNKNNRSYSFDAPSSDITIVDMGEKLWCVVEAFHRSDIYARAYSDSLLLHHSETPLLYPLDPAQFHEVIWPQSVVGSTVSGDDPSAPEEINFDGVHETENIYQSYKSNVITRGEHPYIKITGESNNTASQTTGEIRYWIQLSPLSHDVDYDQEVRFIIEAQGYASVSDSKSESRATAMVSTLGAYYDNVTYAKACSSPGTCLDPSYSELYVNYSFNVDLDFNYIIQVRMVAHLYLGKLGSGEVIIQEPIIRIDPNQMIDGTPANELYEILYSDGISPPIT